MHLPFWLTTALLFPVLLYQGKRARKTTPRLPEAHGPSCGHYGEGQPDLRLLVIGESTAASVGVTTHDQGLASQLALQLHERTGRTISWHTFGVNGIRLDQLNRKLRGVDLPQANVVLLSMGVNDTTGFTPRYRFRRQLLALRDTLAAGYPGPVYLLSVPPIHLFTALPAPLRQVMGWRARQLNSVYEQLARQAPSGFRYLSYPAITDTSLLASDGYHPGSRGYRAIAEALVSQKLKSGAGVFYTADYSERLRGQE
ncbi:SGNH/GDSL hydrolase family protein [Marinobacter panjinensis]|uniref:SGNH/GDSL hydrolase family protein n=1 Tax=Marinobacter panjinensis TaxID=2576384 RepID=A0A4U6R358_9GAMM|nr:SGNH/GDSL hydrolase family protein [Marinobacter panjinensis]MCR8915514.1 SGNH/GDSL hydrolase family protein [Marinobacter panjinensis]TKV66766.1 SGNH/GDSL hydrolase family protein [Marinobacter panjinensis]